MTRGFKLELYFMLLARVGRSSNGYGQIDLIHDFDECFPLPFLINGRLEKQGLFLESKPAILIRYFMGLV